MDLKVGGLVMIDPVSMLLELPDVCHGPMLRVRGNDRGKGKTELKSFTSSLALRFDSCDLSFSLEPSGMESLNTSLAIVLSRFLALSQGSALMTELFVMSPGCKATSSQRHAFIKSQGSTSAEFLWHILMEYTKGVVRQHATLKRVLRRFSRVLSRI